MTRIEKILNGVESRSTGYQDGNRYWNLEFDFEKEYSDPVIGRVVENGNTYVLVMDSVPVDDHISYSSMNPGKDNLVEQNIQADMRDQKELYPEICRILEGEETDIPEPADRVTAASD